MLPDFFALALNNLKRRKLRSWLTMIGIFIGIAAVVALIGLGQGLQEAVTGQFASLSADILTIENSGTGFGPPGSTVIEKLNEHDLKLIKNVDGVEEVIIRLIRIGTIKFNRISNFHYIASMPDNQKQLDIIHNSLNFDVKDGRLLRQEDKGVVIIGSDVAEKSNFGKEVKVGNNVIIEDEKFEVIGIMKKTSNIIFNSAILMPEEDMKELLDIEDEIDMIVVKVSNPKITEKVAENIKKVLRKDREEKQGEEDFSVKTPLEAISGVNNVLTTINIVVIGIALISLIVGGIGIANTMYTSVLERKAEIGTMKAIGARNRDVLVIFLIESGLLGLIGGIVGALIGMGISVGVAIATNSYFGAEFISVNFNIALISSAIAFAFLVGILSGTIPSYQASKLRPVEALRG